MPQRRLLPRGIRGMKMDSVSNSALLFRMGEESLHRHHSFLGMEAIKFIEMRGVHALFVCRVIKRIPFSLLFLGSSFSCQYC